MDIVGLLDNRALKPTQKREELAEAIKTKLVTIKEREKSIARRPEKSKKNKRISKRIVVGTGLLSQIRYLLPPVRSCRRG
jgi:hypothetical protein